MKKFIGKSNFQFNKSFGKFIFLVGFVFLVTYLNAISPVTNFNFKYSNLILNKDRLKSVLYNVHLFRPLNNGIQGDSLENWNFTKVFPSIFLGVLDVDSDFRNYFQNALKEKMTKGGKVKKIIGRNTKFIKFLTPLIEGEQTIETFILILSDKFENIDLNEISNDDLWILKGLSTLFAEILYEYFEKSNAINFFQDNLLIHSTLGVPLFKGVDKMNKADLKKLLFTHPDEYIYHILDNRVLFEGSNEEERLKKVRTELLSLGRVFNRTFVQSLNVNNLGRIYSNRTSLQETLALVLTNGFMERLKKLKAAKEGLNLDPNEKVIDLEKIPAELRNRFNQSKESNFFKFLETESYQLMRDLELIYFSFGHSLNSLYKEGRIIKELRPEDLEDRFYEISDLVEYFKIRSGIESPTIEILIPSSERPFELKDLVESVFKQLKVYSYGKYASGPKIKIVIFDDSMESKIRRFDDSGIEPMYYSEIYHQKILELIEKYTSEKHGIRVLYDGETFGNQSESIPTVNIEIISPSQQKEVIFFVEESVCKKHFKKSF